MSTNQLATLILISPIIATVIWMIGKKLKHVRLPAPPPQFPIHILLIFLLIICACMVVLWIPLIAFAVLAFQQYISPSTGDNPAALAIFIFWSLIVSSVYSFLSDIVTMLTQSALQWNQ